MSEKTLSGILQLVTFKVCEEEYGVDILRVREIIRMIDITRVPRAPDFILGVINLRGQVIPVVSMRRRFGKIPKADDGQTRIVLIEVQGLTVGFVVDAVCEVLRIPETVVEPAPPVTAGADADYIRGMAKLEGRLLLLLDLDRLLGDDEIEKFVKSVQPNRG